MDIEDWLRRKMKRGGPFRQPGRIAVSSWPGKAAIVQIQCETDFTARHDEFIAMTDEVAELAMNRAPGAITPGAELLQPIAEFQKMTGENIDWIRGEVVGSQFIGAACSDDGRAGAIVVSTHELPVSALLNLARHCALVVPALGLTLDHRQPNRELVLRILDEPLNRREGAPCARNLVDDAFSIQRIICYLLD